MIHLLLVTRSPRAQGPVAPQRGEQQRSSALRLSLGPRARRPGTRLQRRRMAAGRLRHRRSAPHGGAPDPRAAGARRAGPGGSSVAIARDGGPRRRFPDAAAALVKGLGRMLALHVFAGVARKPTDELSAQPAPLLSRSRGPGCQPGPGVLALAGGAALPSNRRRRPRGRMRPQARADPTALQRVLVG